MIRFANPSFIASVVSVFWFNTAPACFADQIILKNGGKLTGKIFPSKDEATVVIKTDDGTAFQLLKEDVVKELKSTVVNLDYESLLKQTPDNPEGNKDLAIKCRLGGLSELGKAHYERVVELDPEDKTAWSAINYTYDERYGGWIRKSELNFREEKDEYDGKVMTLHSKAIMTKREEAEKERAELEKRIRIEITRLRRGDKDSVSAGEFLQSVNNPIVIDYLEKQLMEELARGGTGEIYLQMLLQMPGISATQVFLRLAMNTNLPEGTGSIVDQSLEALSRYELSRDIAANYFISALRSDPKKLYKSPIEFQATVKRIDRAAQNLQSIPSELAIVSLIDALVTTGNVVQQRQQTASIDSTGGSGLTTPGSTYSTVAKNQESVLIALQEITKENFSYDRDAWRFWFARKYAHTNLDLRRIE